MLLGPQEAEAEVTEAEAWLYEAIRRPAEAGVAEPAAAPIHPERARHGTPGVRHHTARIWVSGRSVRFCTLSGAFLTSVEVPIERRAVDTKLLRHLTC